MYPAEFSYVRAHSVAEAISLMSEHDGARLLAGGHSLVPLLKLRQSEAGWLVDIGRIASLKGIETTGNAVRVGALTTHAEIAASSAVPAGLAQAASLIGDAQIRNMGTIGGNVAHADPGSDLPTILLALDAVFHVTGPAGDRSIEAKDFSVGMFATALAANELLTAIQVPIEPSGTGSAYAKMIHPASGYALVGVAALIALEDGTCSKASLAFGGLTPHARRASQAASSLVGKHLDAAAIQAAAQAAAAEIAGDVVGDFHASAEYRQAMAVLYAEQALASAVARAGQ